MFARSRYDYESASHEHKQKRNQVSQTNILKAIEKVFKNKLYLNTHSHHATVMELLSHTAAISCISVHNDWLVLQ